MGALKELAKRLEIVEGMHGRYYASVLNGDDVDAICSRHIEMIQRFLREAPEGMDSITKSVVIDKGCGWVTKRIRELEPTLREKMKKMEEALYDQ